MLTGCTYKPLLMSYGLTGANKRDQGHIFLFENHEICINLAPKVANPLLMSYGEAESDWCLTVHTSVNLW